MYEKKKREKEVNVEPAEVRHIQHQPSALLTARNKYRFDALAIRPSDFHLWAISSRPEAALVLLLSSQRASAGRI